MQYKNIEKNNKWEALTSFLGKKRKEEKTVGGRIKKDRVRARPCVELSPPLLSNTVSQRIELI